MFTSRIACSLYVAISAVLVNGSLAASPVEARESTVSAQEDTTVGNELVLRSLALLGVRYRFGGDSPDTGLDCSGLVQHVFREALGFVLPRRSEEMSRAGATVAFSRLQPGDLVFFDTLRRAFSHVGIYIGDNRFVHAPSSGGRVRVEAIDSKYWKRRFNGARRVVTGALGQPEWLHAGVVLPRSAMAAQGAPPMGAPTVSVGTSLPFDSVYSY